MKKFEKNKRNTHNLNLIQGISTVYVIVGEYLNLQTNTFMPL